MVFYILKPPPQSPKEDYFTQNHDDSYIVNLQGQDTFQPNRVLPLNSQRNKDSYSFLHRLGDHPILPA